MAGLIVSRLLLDCIAIRPRLNSTTGVPLLWFLLWKVMVCRAPGAAFCVSDMVTVGTKMTIGRP